MSDLFDELERLVNSDHPDASGELSLFISEHAAALGAEYRRVCQSVDFLREVVDDIRKQRTAIEAENARLAAEVETLKGKLLLWQLEKVTGE